MRFANTHVDCNLNDGMSFCGDDREKAKDTAGLEGFVSHTGHVDFVCIYFPLPPLLNTLVFAGHSSIKSSMAAAVVFVLRASNCSCGTVNATSPLTRRRNWRVDTPSTAAVSCCVKSLSCKIAATQGPAASL